MERWSKWKDVDWFFMIRVLKKEIKKNKISNANIFSWWWSQDVEKQEFFQCNNLLFLLRKIENATKETIVENYDLQKVFI